MHILTWYIEHHPYFSPCKMYRAQIFYLFLRLICHPWTLLRKKWHRILCTWCRSFTRHEKSLKVLHIALETAHIFRVKVFVYESGSRCVVSFIKSSVQKTSSLAHRLTTPFRSCKKSWNPLSVLSLTLCFALAFSFESTRTIFKMAT